MTRRQGRGNRNLAASCRSAFPGNLDFEPSVHLQYFHARWYNPHVGRFIEPDPVERAGGDTQWNNLYVYCLNNPKTLSDPAGLDWGSDAWNFLAGGASWVWNGFVSVVMFIPNEIIATANWLAHASWQEIAGLVGGVLVAVGIGLVIGLSCVFAACAGLILLAAASSAFLLGSVASSITYMAVTKALGGTPTGEGIGHAFFWGGFVAGFAFGGAQSLGKARGWAPKSEAPKPAGMATTKGTAAARVVDPPIDKLPVPLRVREQIRAQLTHIEEHNGAPLPHTKGGRIYENRKGYLPDPPSGTAWQEYDIFPKGLFGRGPERLFVARGPEGEIKSVLFSPHHAKRKATIYEVTWPS